MSFHNNCKRAEISHIDEVLRPSSGFGSLAPVNTSTNVGLSYSGVSLCLPSETYKEQSELGFTFEIIIQFFTLPTLP